MKSFLMAFVLVSAGAAGVAGLSFGVPDSLTKGLPRLGAGTDNFANCLMEVDLDRSASRRARLEASGFYGPYWGPWPYRRW